MKAGSLLGRRALRVHCGGAACSSGRVAVCLSGACCLRPAFLSWECVPQLVFGVSLEQCGVPLCGLYGLCPPPLLQMALGSAEEPGPVAGRSGAGGAGPAVLGVLCSWQRPRTLVDTPRALTPSGLSLPHRASHLTVGLRPPPSQHCVSSLCVWSRSAMGLGVYSWRWATASALSLLRDHFTSVLL